MTAKDRQSCAGPLHGTGENEVDYAIVLAAGNGTRFGDRKQYLDLAGKTVWERSVDALRSAGVGSVVVVVPPDDVARMEPLCRNAQLTLVPGGSSRSQSVQHALVAIEGFAPTPTDMIAIHDGARPFVDPRDVTRVFGKAREVGGAILGRPCTNTLKRMCDGLIDATVPRQDIVLAETPQVFRWDWLASACLCADEQTLKEATDDASLMERQGRPVAVVFAEHLNPKITVPADWDYIQWLARERWGGTSS